jgi:hypothetical protein
MVTLALLGCLSTVVFGVMLLFALRRERNSRILVQNLKHDKHQISIGVIRSVRTLRVVVEKWDRFQNRDVLRDRILHALVSLEEILPEFRKPQQEDKGA